MADTPAPAVKLPDIAAWQKALPLIFALLTAVLTSAGTGNWMIAGKEALKDLPSIFATLGLTGGGILAAIASLWTAMSNNSKTNSLIDKLKGDLLNIKNKLGEGDLQTFLDQVQSGVTAPSADVSLNLPGLVLSIDTATFGFPTADSRKLIVSSVDAFLANLEKKAVSP